MATILPRSFSRALKSVMKGPIDNNPALVHTLVCYQTYKKSLPEPMVTKIFDTIWCHYAPIYQIYWANTHMKFTDRCLVARYTIAVVCKYCKCTRIVTCKNTITMISLKYGMTEMDYILKKNYLVCLPIRFGLNSQVSLNRVWNKTKEIYDNLTQKEDLLINTIWHIVYGNLTKKYKSSLTI